MRSSQRLFYRSLLLTVSLGYGTINATAVLAQDPISSFFSDKDVWVGGGIGIKPLYEGSKEYQTYAVPDFQALSHNNKPGIITSRGFDGIGLSLNGLAGYDLGGFEFGPVLGYNFGRDEDLATRLTGLGDVEAGVTAGGYVAYRTSSLWLDAAMTDFVSGDTEGMTLRLSAQIQQPVNENLSLWAGVNAIYADEDYMDSFFTVTAAQSAASGLAQYDAEAGFKSVSATLGLSYKLTNDWMVSTEGSYTQLLDNAADSSIVEDRNQYSALLTLKYKLYSGQ